MKNICFFFLFILLGNILLFYLSNHQEIFQQEGIMKSILPNKVMQETSEEKKENEAINSIAQLSFSNLDFSISIGQSKDNSYYLNHSLTGEESSIGAPFLDYRNQLSDQKILVYGHNSETISTEFHFLENYLDSNFLKNHSFITLEWEEKSIYQIFSVMIVTDDFQHMKLAFKAGEYQEHLQWLKNNSKIDTGVLVDPFDSILILQTCYYHPKGSYLLVVGKKV